MYHYFGDCTNIHTICIITQEFSVLGITILAAPEQRGAEVIGLINESVELPCSPMRLAVKGKKHFDLEGGKREGTKCLS